MPITAVPASANPALDFVGWPSGPAYHVGQPGKTIYDGAVTVPAHGTVFQHAGLTMYQPNPGFVGLDHFDYLSPWTGEVWGSIYYMVGPTITLTPDQYSVGVSMVQSHDADVLTPMGGPLGSPDPRPIISGVGAPGTLVTVKDGTTVVGTVTADATGHWSLTPATPLAMQTDSFYALKVIARLPDDASAQVADDQISGAPSIAVIPDAAQAHTPVITHIADDTGAVQGAVSRLYGATDDTTPTFTGTGTPGALVWLESDLVNGVPLGEATVGDDGVWTITPTDPLPYGGTAAVDIALFSNSPPGFLPLATTDFVGARLFVTADGTAPSLDTLLATAGLPVGTQASASPVTSAPTATAAAFDAGQATPYSINPIPVELAA